MTTQNFSAGLLYIHIIKPCFCCFINVLLDFLGCAAILAAAQPLKIVFVVVVVVLCCVVLCCVVAAKSTFTQDLLT